LFRCRSAFCTISVYLRQINKYSVCRSGKIQLVVLFHKAPLGLPEKCPLHLPPGRHGSASTSSKPDDRFGIWRSLPLCRRQLILLVALYRYTKRWTIVYSIIEEK